MSRRPLSACIDKKSSLEYYTISRQGELNMKFKLVIFLTIVILLIACENQSFLVQIYGVDIPERIDFGQDIIFKMYCETPTPGYKFSHIDLKNSGTSVWIKAYAKGKGAQIQVLDSFEATCSFKPRMRGIYLFHFWQIYTDEYLVYKVAVE